MFASGVDSAARPASAVAVRELIIGGQHGGGGHAVELCIRRRAGQHRFAVAGE